MNIFDCDYNPVDFVRVFKDISIDWFMPGDDEIRIILKDSFTLTKEQLGTILETIANSNPDEVSLEDNGTLRFWWD